MRFVEEIREGFNVEEATKLLEVVTQKEPRDRKKKKKEPSQESILFAMLFDKAVLLENGAFLDRLVMLYERKEQPIANLLRRLKSAIVLGDS